jgi:hypothetical protein
MFGGCGYADMRVCGASDAECMNDAGYMRRNSGYNSIPLLAPSLRGLTMTNTTAYKNFARAKIFLSLIHYVFR